MKYQNNKDLAEAQYYLKMLVLTEKGPVPAIGDTGREIPGILTRTDSRH